MTVLSRPPFLVLLSAVATGLGLALIGVFVPTRLTPLSLLAVTMAGAILGNVFGPMTAHLISLAVYGSRPRPQVDHANDEWNRFLVLELPVYSGLVAVLSLAFVFSRI